VREFFVLFCFVFGAGREDMTELLCTKFWECERSGRELNFCVCKALVCWSMTDLVRNDSRVCQQGSSSSTNFKVVMLQSHTKERTC
jgi:hypothetical protein